MSKFTKNSRIADLESKLIVMQTQINSLIASTHDSTKRLIALEPDNPFHGKFYEPREPKLKQLDQSVFDGLDEKWRFAAFNIPSNSPIVFSVKPHESMFGKWYAVLDVDEYMVLDQLEGAYEYTEDWQNSLIERDKVELTGSDLCRAMLERGDKVVLCAVSENENYGFEAGAYDAICRVDEDGLFESHCTFWWYVQPVNNQGEPLTAADVGL